MSDRQVPDHSTQDTPTQPSRGGDPDGFTSEWAPHLRPMSQEGLRAGQARQETRVADQSHAAMAQASDSTIDPAHPHHEDPYADLLGIDAHPAAQGSAPAAAAGSHVGFTSGMEPLLASEARTQAAQEDAQEVRLGSPRSTGT